MSLVNTVTEPGETRTLAEKYIRNETSLLTESLRIGKIESYNTFWCCNLDLIQFFK